MADQSVTSDVGVGIGVLFSVLAVAAAAVTAVVSPEATVAGDVRISALGFAAATVAGVVAVVAIHLYRWE